MAVITRYELRVEGLLNGPLVSNPDEVALFKKTLTEVAPKQGEGGPGSTAPWPEGFVLRGYTPYIWKPEGFDHAHGNHTMLSFHAEVAIIFEGSSHVPATQERARQEYDWFLAHDGLTWCQDLMARLETLNNLKTLNDHDSFAAKLVERIHMRRFHWYIGNGGS